MGKKSLNPATIEKRFRELRRCTPITVAKLKRIPADKGGVYCFYWAGSARELVGKSFDVPAPFGRPRNKVVINKEWVSSASGKEVPLYAGSSTKLRKRLQQHWARHTSHISESSSSTTTQVRKALQKIFSKKGEAKRLFEERVVVRYVPEENPITRFYLEHKLIGDLLPLFNVKPEH